MRKVLGVIFYAIGVLGAIGSMINGLDNIVSLITTLLLLVLFAISGNYLLRFDWDGEADPVVRYTHRRSKRTGTIVFMVIYLVLFLVVALGPMLLNLPSSISLETYLRYQDNQVMLYLLYAAPMLPYAFGWMVFIMMFLCYFLGTDGCEKHLGDQVQLYKTYLPDVRQLRSICPNGSVQTNGLALYFPKVCCLVPLAAIRDVKMADVGMEKIVLKNGKSLLICSGQHKYIKAFLQEQGILK